MITDLTELIQLCKDELHDREYHAHHASLLTSEWNAISCWLKEHKIQEFDRETAFSYCDEMIGSHIITKELSVKQKKRDFGLSGCYCLTRKQEILNFVHQAWNTHSPGIQEKSFSVIFNMKRIKDARKRLSAVNEKPFSVLIAILQKMGSALMT